MKKLMAANWKMYKTAGEAGQTASDLVTKVGGLPDDREVLICPPFTAISAVARAFEGAGGFSVGGQNFYPEDEGAFTGEIGPSMLKDLGCTYVLAGHSERRHVMGEDDEFIAKKVGFGLEKGFKVILCIGELIDERKAGKVEEVLTTQLEIGLSQIDRAGQFNLAVAYEPVWAIGTGETAGPEDILQAHELIRNKLVSMLGNRGTEIRILYGGSVKPANCAEIIGLDNVDGVLVGGASLKADSFSTIVLAGT